MERQYEYQPCIPTRGTKVPAGPEWLHEIKHDGYRLIVQREGKRVRPFTRNGHDWSDRYPSLRKPRCVTATPSSSSMAKPCCSALMAGPISTPCTRADTMPRSSSTPSTNGEDL